MKLIHANIVYSEDRDRLAVYADSYIVVEDGRVKGIWPEIPERNGQRSFPSGTAGADVTGPLIRNVYVSLCQAGR